MASIGVETAAGNPWNLRTEVASAQPKVVHAAYEFEAQMMMELLKPLTHSDGLTGNEDDSSYGSGGALGEFASEALAQAVSQQGGLGIAHLILSNLSHSGNHACAAKVTGNQHENNEIKRSE
jgi:Rod binding domain-containing protein